MFENVITAPSHLNDWCVGMSSEFWRHLSLLSSFHKPQVILISNFFMSSSFSPWKLSRLLCPNCCEISCVRYLVGPFMDTFLDYLKCSFSLSFLLSFEIFEIIPNSFLIISLQFSISAFLFYFPENLFNFLSQIFYLIFSFCLHIFNSWEYCLFLECFFLYCLLFLFYTFSLLTLEILSFAFLFFVSCTFSFLPIYFFLIWPISLYLSLIFTSVSLYLILNREGFWPQGMLLFAVIHARTCISGIWWVRPGMLPSILQCTVQSHNEESPDPK